MYMYLRTGGTVEDMDTKELMMIKMENQDPYHHMGIPSDPFSSLPLDTATASAFGSNHADDQRTSLGFMELLGFQDFTATYKYSSPSSIFDSMMMYRHQLPPPSSSLSMDMEIPTSSAHPSNQHDTYSCDDHHHDHKEEDVTTVDEAGEESSVVLNARQPSSPNSSSLSSPSAAAAAVDQRLQNPLKQCMRLKKTTDEDEAQTKTKKKKKEREARFAFMTRTEIDHLDDGYRWRKYGQKAVKNSPFPRSYYRCTSASCNVKKRVERCMGDPSFVVTTYEGQHIHPSPSASAAPTLIPSFHHPNNINIITPTYAPPPPLATPAAMIMKLDQGAAGLLQDMLLP